MNSELGNIGGRDAGGGCVDALAREGVRAWLGLGLGLSSSRLDLSIPIAQIE